VKLNVVFVHDDVVLPEPQIHVSKEAEATDEKQYYDVTKPESFVIKVFGSTLILLT